MKRSYGHLTLRENLCGRHGMVELAARGIRPIGGSTWAEPTPHADVLLIRLSRYVTAGWLLPGH